MDRRPSGAKIVDTTKPLTNFEHLHIKYGLIHPTDHEHAP